MSDFKPINKSDNQVKYLPKKCKKNQTILYWCLLSLLRIYQLNAQIIAFFVKAIHSNIDFHD